MNETEIKQLNTTLKLLKNAFNSGEGYAKMSEVILIFEAFKVVTQNILTSVNSSDVKIQELAKAVNSITSQFDKSFLSKLKDSEKQWQKKLQLVEDIVSTMQSKLESSVNAIDTRITDLENEEMPEMPEMPEETPQDIRNKLETLVGNQRLDKSAINGLDDELKSIRSDIKTKNPVTIFGGKQMRMVPFSFNGDGSTVDFYLPATPGALGKAIFAYYQGQHMQLGTQYTLANKLLHCIFTPANGTIIDGYLITQ